MRTLRLCAWTFAVFVLGYVAGQAFDDGSTANAQGRKVFELRTYTAPEGKLPALLARFGDYTLDLFEKHGMENVGYWVPQDAPASGNTLIYILAHDSREAAAKSWDGFRQDADWARIRAESEANGPIVEKVEAVFLEATSFSPLQ